MIWAFMAGIITAAIAHLAESNNPPPNFDISACETTS